EVADRMELQRALRGIAALRPADREAIIDAVTEEATPRSRKEAVKLAVRRHRRTTAALAVVPAAAVVLPLVGVFVVPGLHGATRPPAVLSAVPEARRMDQTLVVRADRTASSRSAVSAATVPATTRVTSSATRPTDYQPINQV